MDKTFTTAAILCFVSQSIIGAGETGPPVGASGAGLVVRAPSQRLLPQPKSAAPLRAAPLLPDTLARPVNVAPPVRATHSMQYGPNVTRPSGSVVAPFGSSGYWYRR